MTLASTGIRRLILPTVARRALVRSSSSALGVSGGAVRQFSSEAPATANTATDPAVKVQGVSAEDLESNPNLASFFAANFEDEKASEDDADDEDELFLAMMGGAAAAEDADEQQAPPAAAQEAAAPPASTVPLPAIDDALAARNIRPLACFLRSRESEDGTRACNALREVYRQIPGVIYGSDPTKDILSRDYESNVTVKTPWNQIQRELDRYHHGFESRVYELTVYKDEEAALANDGSDYLYKQLVRPANMQRHPIQNKIYCVNFLRYHPGRPIRIPIRYINEEESPALKRGGFIVPINKTVECIVEDGAAIPESIDLECTGLQLKAKLRLDNLIFPEGVRPSGRVKDDYLVGIIYGKSAGEDEEGAAAAEEEAAA